MIKDGPRLVDTDGKPVTLAPGPSFVNTPPPPPPRAQESPTRIDLRQAAPPVEQDWRPVQLPTEGFVGLRTSSLIAGGLGVLLLAFFTFEAADLVVRMYALGPVFGTLCLSALAGGVGLIGLGARRELAGMRRLASAVQLRRKITDEDVPMKASISAACAWAEEKGAGPDEILALQKCPNKNALRGVLRQQVSEKLAERATGCVRAAVVQTAAISAASPSRAFDTFAFLVIAARMARNIAGVYGLKPSLSASLLLVKRAIFDTTLLLSTEVAADTALKLVGNSLVAKVLNEAAGAAVSANRMAALGRRMIRICDPLAPA